jgi:7-cyano-7-deazaguanine synthase
MKSAVVLLSGGLDSAVAAAVAQSQGFAVHALGVDYGQQHVFELRCAEHVASVLGIQFRQAEVVLPFSNGYLLGGDQPEMLEGLSPAIVHGRNALLLSLAFGYAESLGSLDIFVGFNHDDQSGFPDCRPPFIAAMERAFNFASSGKKRVSVHAPLVGSTKRQIVALGIQLGVQLQLTSSCYKPSSCGAPCGECAACTLREAAFSEQT